MMRRNIILLLLIVTSSTRIFGQDSSSAYETLEDNNSKNSESSVKKTSSENTSATFLKFNSESADVFPRFWNNGLIFSSNRGRTKSSKSKSNFDLYTVTNFLDPEPKKIKNRLNTRFNETSPYLSKDGSTMYFSRNKLDPHLVGRKRKSKVPLKSFIARKKGNRWKAIRELPFNQRGYSVAHLVLNDTEDMIYFVSDMPGGYGGMDIYQIPINEDGSYGEVKNLGPRVNSHKDETSPYIVGNKTLYFASEGHNSKGGLDIFRIGLEEGEIEQLGSKVNGPLDDYGLIVDMESETAYFASNRNNIRGTDDVFSLPVSELTSMQDEKEHEQIKEKEIIAENSVDKNSINETEHQEVNQSKNSYKNDLAYDNLLQIVLFNFNDSGIKLEYHGKLNDLSEFMANHPELEIMIVGHTDYHGSPEFNKKLSLERAYSVRQYLRLNGIALNRIAVEGKGESSPAVDCNNCKIKEVEKNRRVELFIKEN